MRLFTLLLLAITCQFGYAQSSFTYSVNIVNANGVINATEIWSVSFASAGQPAYVITKNPVPKKENGYGETVETAAAWTKTITMRGSPAHLTERYTINPINLKPGEKSFGHVEVRNGADGEIVAQWPLFYSVQRAENLHLIEYIAHLPGKKKIIIKEWFSPLQFHFPYQKVVEQYTEEKVTEVATFKRN